MKHHDTPKPELTKAMASRLARWVSDELSHIGYYKQDYKVSIRALWKKADKNTEDGKFYFTVLNKQKDHLRDLKAKEKKLVETVKVLKALR